MKRVITQVVIKVAMKVFSPAQAEANAVDTVVEEVSLEAPGHLLPKSRDTTDHFVPSVVLRVSSLLIRSLIVASTHTLSNETPLTLLSLSQ